MPKYRLTIEEEIAPTEDNPNVTYRQCLVVNDVLYFHHQERKKGCVRVFARNDACSSCMIIERDMQKEGTR